MYDKYKLHMMIYLFLLVRSIQVSIWHAYKASSLFLKANSKISELRTSKHFDFFLFLRYYMIIIDFPNQNMIQKEIWRDLKMKHLELRLPPPLKTAIAPHKHFPYFILFIFHY